MKRILFSVISILFFLGSLNAQTTYQERAQAYVDKYKDWAMMEQIRSGIPASITLAQGILETSAGESELCNNANNHFGIKCKSNWSGPTYAYTDDAKDECFRKYKSAYDSYKDHSDFLKNNARYSSLFLYSPIDYKAWARGLKKCGYATNPQYAVKLIKFIEDFGLEQFTVLAMNKANVAHLRNIAEKEGDSKVEVLDAGFENMGYYFLNDSTSENKTIEYYIPERKNDLNGFYAKKGDLLLEYALAHKIRYSKLLFWNDLEDKTLTEDMFIYTESKHKKGLNAIHTFKTGESLHSVSQEEGIQLGQLLLLNHLSSNDLPKVGSILTLQEMNEHAVALNENSSLSELSVRKNKGTKENADDFIIIKRNEAEKEVVNEVPVEEKIVERKATPKMEVTTSETKENKTVEPEEETPIVPKKEIGQSIANTSETVADNTVANEKAVPVVEQKEQTKKSVKQVEQDEKDTTPLDKLKAYMDKTVYGNKEPEAVKQEPREKKTLKRTPTEKLKAYMDKTVNENTETKEQHTTPTLPAAKQITKPHAEVVKAKNDKATYHIVKRGDTAFSISKKYGISLSQLKEWNHLPSSMVVSLGDKLRVK